MEVHAVFANMWLCAIFHLVVVVQQMNFPREMRSTTQHINV